MIRENSSTHAALSMQTTEAGPVITDEYRGVFTDILSQGLVYNNNLTLDGVAVSGNITTGFNIGSITHGQTKTVTYWAQVAQGSY